LRTGGSRDESSRSADSARHGPADIREKIAAGSKDSQPEFPALIPPENRRTEPRAQFDDMELMVSPLAGFACGIFL